MDYLTAWINNNQLIDRIGEEDLQNIQDDIIKNVFGGFKNMLQMVMADKNKMTYPMHDKLYNILQTEYGGIDFYDNYTSNTRGSAIHICDF